MGPFKYTYIFINLLNARVDILCFININEIKIFAYYNFVKKKPSFILKLFFRNYGISTKWETLCKHFVGDITFRKHYYGCNVKVLATSSQSCATHL